MQKPVNQPVMQLNWLITTKRESKITEGLRADQSAINTCYFIIWIKKLLKLVIFTLKIILYFEILQQNKYIS